MTAKASETPSARPYSRKPWSKLLSPQELLTIMEEYESGSSTDTIRSKWGVSRSWLYRERKKWMTTSRPKDDLIFLRAEIARLKDIIVRLAGEKYGDEQTLVLGERPD